MLIILLVYLKVSTAIASGDLTNLWKCDFSFGILSITSLLWIVLVMVKINETVDFFKCKPRWPSLLLCRFVLILNAKKAELRACQSQQSSKEPLHGQRGSDESDAHDEEEDDDRSEGDDEMDTAAATSVYGASPPPLSSSSQTTRSPVKRPLKKEKSSSKAGSDSALALGEESVAHRGDDFQQGPAEGTQEVKAGDLDRLLTQDQLHDQQPPMSPPPLPPPVVSSWSSSSSSSGTSLSIPSPSANSTRQRPPPPKRHM